MNCKRRLEHLQRSNELRNSDSRSKENNLELALIDDSIEYLSDGAGTKDKSNMGIHFQSGPNLDGEADDQNHMVGTQRKNNKKHIGPIRRSTRTVKERRGLKIYQF